MKRDIRTLFKDDNRNDYELPEGHREEFLKKLEQPSKRRYTLWMRIAAVFVVALALSYTIYKNMGRPSDTLPILAQIEAMEVNYLKSIDKEWQSFVAIAEDKALVNRYRKKLDDLSKNYEELSIQFKGNPDDIIVVEQLVANLQRRLDLLKDIQSHIIILNQKNEHHEKQF